MSKNKNTREEDLKDALACLENAIEAIIEYNDLYESYVSLLEAIALLSSYICESEDIKKAHETLYRAWKEAYYSSDLELVKNTLLGNLGNAKGILSKIVEME